MEPRAATPARRLHAIAELTRAGVPAGVMVAPMIPGLNDAEMEKIVEAAARAGARHAGYVLLRLPHELRQMFEDWLATHFPDRAKHVLSLIRETRGGALNDSRFHHRFAGQGVYADLLLRRFTRATRQWGLDEAREGLDCSQVRGAGGSGRRRRPRRRCRCSENTVPTADLRPFQPPADLALAPGGHPNMSCQFSSVNL